MKLGYLGNKLFPDHNRVRVPLMDLGGAEEEGVFLVCTCRNGYPQFELVARPPTGHCESRPWAVRRRSHQEMDQIVAAPGSGKGVTAINTNGIVTFSPAHKRPRAATAGQTARLADAD